MRIPARYNSRCEIHGIFGVHNIFRRVESVAFFSLSFSLARERKRERGLRTGEEEEEKEKKEKS